MQIGTLSIDSIISNIKPSSQKINYQKTRSLSGKLWSNYVSIKKSWTLEFEELTKTERDSLYSQFISTSTFTFIDENNVSYLNCQITSENFEDNITWDKNGTLYYFITLQIDEG